MRRLAKVDLLVLDDWGLQGFSAEGRRDLLEIVEARYARKSIVVASQIPVERWPRIIGEATIADAVLDRIVHNAYRIELTGESQRKRNKPPPLDASDPEPPSGDDVDASCGPSAVYGTLWTRRGQVRGTCPPLAHTRRSRRPHPHRFNNMILVITITGAFGAIASARTGGRAARWLMRSSPPSSIPHCTVTRARLRSQPAGRWPAPSSTKGETTPQTREREAPPRPVRARRNRGQVTQESRSSVPGIAVKCAEESAH